MSYVRVCLVKSTTSLCKKKEHATTIRPHATHTQIQDNPIELKRCATDRHTTTIKRKTTNRDNNKHEIIVYHCIRAPPLHEERGHTRPQSTRKFTKTRLP